MIADLFVSTQSISRFFFIAVVLIGYLKNTIVGKLGEKTLSVSVCNVDVKSLVLLVWLNSFEKAFAG